MHASATSWRKWGYYGSRLIREGQTTCESMPLVADLDPALINTPYYSILVTFTEIIQASYPNSVLNLPSPEICPAAVNQNHSCKWWPNGWMMQRCRMASVLQFEPENPSIGKMQCPWHVVWRWKMLVARNRVPGIGKMYIFPLNHSINRFDSQTPGNQRERRL